MPSWFSLAVGPPESPVAASSASAATLGAGRFNDAAIPGKGPHHNRVGKFMVTYPVEQLLAVRPAVGYMREGAGHARVS
jgi:hypothetical protein